MDYPEDWQVLQAVLSKITPFASARMICEYLDHHTELLDINALPKISFYTCAYNAEATIGKTIASVLNCGIENFEYIIVDDASTDNTISTIAQFSRDKRIRLVVNEQNRGLATSSNTAIALSRGRFIMRVDADDVLMPHNFQEGFWDMAKELNEGAVVVYPAYKEIGNTTRPDAIVPGDECHHAGCALMLRSVLNEMRFRDGIRHWDGLELLNRVSKKHGAVAYYNIPIWYYRVSEKSMSNTDTDTRASMRIELGLNGIEVKK
jgi:glycosyltransferase involved in cell wall biosynthesis